FVLSGRLAGLAGSVFRIRNRFAALDLLHRTASGSVGLTAVLAGRGALWGSAVGAAFALLREDQLSSFTDASGVVTGAILVAIVIFFRRGLWPTLSDLVRRTASSPGGA